MPVNFLNDIGRRARSAQYVPTGHAHRAGLLRPKGARRVLR